MTRSDPSDVPAPDPAVGQVPDQPAERASEPVPDSRSDQPPDRPADRSSGRGAVAILDRAVRVVGGLVAVAAAVVTAVLELIFSTLRLGGPLAGLFGDGEPPLVGVSIVLAVVCNIAVAWFAHRVIGRVWAVALPAVAWFAVMLAAAGRTDEGDILLINWVGVVTVFGGSMAFAGMAFRLILAGAGAPRGG